MKGRKKKDEVEEFRMKPGMRYLANLFSHTKAEDDYLNDAMNDLDNPILHGKLSKYREKLVSPKIELLQQLLTELYPDCDMDKCMKALEVDSDGPVPASSTGENQKVNQFSLPEFEMEEEAEGLEGLEALGMGAQGGGGGTSPVGSPEWFAEEANEPEHQRNGEVDEEELRRREEEEEEREEREEMLRRRQQGNPRDRNMPADRRMADGPASDERGAAHADDRMGEEPSTEEILMRYQTPKGWGTRKIGFARRAKNGKLYIVKTIDNDVKKNPQTTFKPTNTAPAVPKPTVPKPSQGSAQPSAATPAIPTSGAKMIGSTLKSIESVEKFVDAVCKSQRLPQQCKIAAVSHCKSLHAVRKGLARIGEDKGKVIQPLSDYEKALHATEKFLDMMTSDPAVPKQYKEAAREYSKGLYSVRKSLTDMGKLQKNNGKGSPLSDMGKVQRDGGKGTPLKNEGSLQRNSNRSANATIDKNLHREVKKEVADRFAQFERRISQLTGISLAEV